VRILIFHGYLLRGTGSNVYNASLAPALAALGHDVHLLCQDRRAGELDWVDAYGEWGDGELTVSDAGGAGGSSPRVDGHGSVTVYVPEIDGLLPVYVADEYPGFEVKEFRELSEDELSRYLEANVAAVREVAERAGGVDAALANHLVMGPVILARAGLEFAAKVHGSALEYTVKRDPERFLPYAVEGIRAANAVLVGSRHTGESLWAALEGEEAQAKTRLGPPGVDTKLFRPIDRDQAGPRARAFADTLDSDAEPDAGAWGRDPALAEEAISTWAGAGGDRVLFVGKLIVSKGVDLLLAAWPLAHAVKPGSRLLIVGFGEYRDGLLRLWAALERGDLADVADVAAAGWELEGGERRPLRMLETFLAELPDGYTEKARAAAGSVDFAGRLEHDEVAAILPSADSLVFPSTFPEAFGMVAAEAAAAGVLPVSAAHSGALEVSRTLGAELEPALARLLSFPLGEGAVTAIAERLAAWAALPEPERGPVRSALAALAAGRYGWEGVARGVIAASAGRLDELAEVPE
jgi:glycosyltransferase involved in cell wall biosynthesis